jgi:AcrR family transcriptional regulator
MLITAAMECLARDGVQGFTINRICKQAGVSRGLINHYFDSKDDLLVEVYRDSLYKMVSTRIAQLSSPVQAGDDTPYARLAAIIDATFTPEFFSRANLRVWLALWGEIASNTKLRAAHHQLYKNYRRAVAREIGSIAEARGIKVDPDKLALSFLALVDGLWLEWCLDDTAVAPGETRAVAMAMLEAHLGPLGRP